MRDVTERVLNNLLHRSADGHLQNLPEPSIVVCVDLPPSAAASLDRQKVLGLATDTGSRTSHTAIMARSLHLPAIVGLRDASSKLATGDYALLDGYSGTLIVNPTDQTLFEYGQLVRKHVNFEEKLHELRDKPAVTLDGVRIGLLANIEQPSDTDAVKESGAEGVGLFRTEYLFINREIPPSEEEQYEAYKAVAEALNPAQVVIRTLDLGGDKLLSHSKTAPEMNPFLGWRAIRFCLVEKDMFRAQLRAILRASAHGDIRMMYPMISSLREVLEANALLEECRVELRAAGVPFNEKLGAGVMIEVPSAALITGTLAKHVRFFSIGTNDLIQYSLAVDRLNEKIAHLYEPTHPGILSLIKMTADAGIRHGIPVSVCGEMAGDPLMVPLLIGLGVTELSVSPSVAPQIKFLLRRLKLSEARELAAFALESESPDATLRRAGELVRSVAPGLVDISV
jgi:phosphotransferase system enzyme I (PtsI)